MLSWNQEEVCNPHRKPVHLELSNQERGSNVGPEKRQVKSCRALLALGEKKPKIWHLSSQWLSCPKSNVIQTTGRKEKYFPLPKEKKKTKISQFWMCISNTICMCGRLHARQPARETEIRKTKEGYSERCANMQGHGGWFRGGWMDGSVGKWLQK